MSTKLTEFWSKWKVFILGALSAVVLALQELIFQPEVNDKVLILAGVMALLSFVAKEWRGQGMTVFGIIGIVAATILSEYQPGHEVNWLQLILSIIGAVVTAALSNPKPVSYEQHPVINEAKTGTPPTYQDGAPLGV